MGYVEIYEIEFIARTKKFLESYQKKGDYKLTMLLNCMVGLVFIPNERNKYHYPAIWNKGIQDIPIFKQNNIRITTWTQNGNVRFEQFIRKLRNGIAHQNIEPINQNKKFVGVRIWNINRKKVKDFEISLNRKQLLVVANFIADQYLNHISQAQKSRIISSKEL